MFIERLKDMAKKIIRLTEEELREVDRTAT